MYICNVQPNFVQGLHTLLLQSTSNDTAQLKAVRSFDQTRFFASVLMLLHCRPLLS